MSDYMTLISFIPSREKDGSTGYQIEYSNLLKEEVIKQVEDIVLKNILNKIPTELGKFHMEKSIPFFNIGFSCEAVRFDSIYMGFLEPKVIDSLNNIVVAYLKDRIKEMNQSEVNNSKKEK